MRKVFGKIANLSKKKQLRRKLSIRKKIIGSAERPRLCVIKTNKNLQVQIVDDSIGKTIMSAQTFGKNKVVCGNNKDNAKELGKAVADKLKENSISEVVFDRNGKVYTGVIAALADSVRENGIRL